MSWIGFDLDGTLAYQEEGQNDTIGQPIMHMVYMVKDYVEKGYDVRIFTARAGSQDEIKKVNAWLKDNGMEGVTVTNVKEQGMIMLFDDKAIRVEHNTGNLCVGCKPNVVFSRLPANFDSYKSFL